ncbi:hypothetical protein [uncultured Jannaschia sp.]|uniref:hypothetical protein n=1 Tax=uncultured Jannaschia sp. TaxID=293347 RepID=UPI002635B6D2|nr:hypothetical protein [uncultured Jannaschia sp.]
MQTTPPAPTSSAAGIPRSNLYRLSQPFFDLVHSRGLGLQGLRLVHLIAHATRRKVPNWHNLTVQQPEEGDRQECLEFRRRLGLGRSGDNGALADGIAELSRTDLLEWISFEHDHHWLSWRLCDGLFDLLFDGAYGYFDIDQLRRLGTPLDLMIYGEVGIIRGMQQPAVSLDLARYGASLGRSSDWSRLRPDLVRALQRAAALYDCGFLLQLECRGTRRGIDVVTLRARTVRSRWSWKALTKKPQGVPVRKVLLIDAGRCHESTSEAASADAKTFFGAGPQTPQKK